ncbi:MAG: TylF/MycF/NovP-related O-methyltransferase [Silvibacterium sp.]
MRSLKAIARERLPKTIFNTLQNAYHHITGPNEHQVDEYQDRYEFLRKALTTLRFNRIAGDYAEFGCCGAVTFNIAYRLMSKYPGVGPFHLWAFDSFEGLPETVGEIDAHPIWTKGNFSMSLQAFHRTCKSKGMPRSAYTVVQGFYDQSLAPTAPGPRPTQICLAYIDCDMYSSTSAVFKFLMPRLQHGMILAFDDYYCYSSEVPSGERLALAEAFRDNTEWRLLPYVQFGWAGMSFIVESAKTPTGRQNAYW